MSTAVAADVPLCFLDTETDGTHDDRQIWEVGAIRRDLDGTELSYRAFLEIDLSQTPEGFGLRVGKFWDRHPYGRRLATLPALGADTHDPRFEALLELTPWPTVATSLARITHGTTIVGANPGFDTTPIARKLREHELMPTWHYHLGDITQLAVGYLAARGTVMLPPWRTAELAELLGVEPDDEGKHTALGDCRFAARVYDIVMSGGAS